ncbi:MAG: hypothetical protein K5647_07825 [Clostridiales bacterium]|nr:hypothetical protein [Clostridiales bacterium]
MKQELYDFDIFPKVFLTGRPAHITVKPLGVHAAFPAALNIRIRESAVAEDGRYPGSNGSRDYAVSPSDDGCVRIDTDFKNEGMYHIQFFREGEKKRFLELRVYALAADMAGRYPFRGDLHMHTCRSDGREGPAVVAANYRRHGYDFTVISDHRRYYPSLEARAAFGIGKDDRSPLTDYLIVPGEEIHLPQNDAHYVNFGGKWSINALVEPNRNCDDRGNSPEVRSLDGVCPEPMTDAEFRAMIAERAKDVPLPLESERLSFAALEWEHEQVAKAGGLGIFPHPYWLCSTMQISEKFLRFVYERQPFDAFEVLGGESYFQHNGFQTALYYEERVRGFDPPVVGSTDSHGSTEYNRNRLVCSTLIFSPENRTDSLIDSVKKKYSVALDTISAEYRVVGDFRWVKYAAFLEDEYFPLHDLLTSAEGTYLKRYACGDASAEKVLLAMKGQIPAMLEKYFDIKK